jgi:NADH dehydrogenase
MTKRIVVVGGGYGGVALIRRLAALGLEDGVTLIDRNACHTVLTEIHQVAAGAEPPDLFQIPYTAMGRFSFVQAEVTGLDTLQRHVLTTAGPVAYDLLVLSPGGVDTDYGVPGVREHALTLHHLADALTIRERLAALPDGAPLLIAGGGFTGVELAGELGERFGGGANITLVEGAATILPGLPGLLRRRARRRLGALGVGVLTGLRISRVEPGMAHFADGSALPFALMVWACGVRANPLIERLGLPVDKAGRAIVGADMQTAVAGVYAIGDSAAGAPPTAQAACQQGAVLADHLAGLIAGRPAPVRPVRMLGALVALGHGYGAGVITGLPLVGWIPALVKRANVARWFLTAAGPGAALRYFFGLTPAAGAKALARHP